MTKNGLIGWNLLELAGKIWKLSDIAGNGLNWLDIAGMAGNGLSQQDHKNKQLKIPKSFI